MARSPDMRRVVHGWGRRQELERGAALAEWALLVLLIAIVAMIGVVVAGQGVSTQYSVIATEVGSATS
jgi:Flp pilus assembly pilin Flp